jgi:ABC-type lipoprotein release transport system permease subunit
MTIAERTRDIGMLRAIGMGRWGVIRMVLAEAVLLSVVGSLLGLGAGLLLARLLIRIVGEVIIPIQGLAGIPIQGLLQSLVVGVVVTLGAALIPAVQAAFRPWKRCVRSRSVERIRPRCLVSGLVMILVATSSYHIDVPHRCASPWAARRSWSSCSALP